MVSSKFSRRPRVQPTPTICKYPIEAPGSQEVGPLADIDYSFAITDPSGIYFPDTLTGRGVLRWNTSAEQFEATWAAVHFLLVQTIVQPPLSDIHDFFIALYENGGLIFSGYHSSTKEEWTALRNHAQLLIVISPSLFTNEFRYRG